MEKKMEHDMEIGIIKGIIGIRVSQKLGVPLMFTFSN